MKKLVLILFLLFLITGCTTIDEESIENIVSQGMNSNVNISNVTRTGYKYYIPNGMKTIDSQDYNEIIYNDKYPFYLYVDVVSYYNKIKSSYKVNKSYYTSLSLSHEDKFGYLQIKSLENEKYFIEIMYNYAKIEVIVEKDRANTVIAYAMSILSSISYQDEVLTSLMGEDVLKSNEVEYNIFESAETESEYLQIVEEYGQYEEKDELVDPDFIRR